MAALGGLVPILAPMFGGMITDSLGWRYNFWFLVLFAILVSAIIAIKLPETLACEKRQPLHVPLMISTYWSMLKSPTFIVVILPLELAFGVQGAYLSSSPFIFIKGFGLTPTAFGVMNVVVVGALVGGRFLATYLIEKTSTYFAYVTGAMLLFLGGFALLQLDLFSVSNLLAILAALSLAVGGFGVLLPIGLKSIMTAFKHQSGSVSALHGCLSLGSAAAGSFIFSKLMSTYKIEPLGAMAKCTVTIGAVAFMISLLSKKHLN
jgi:DHA1 family bicyclomycin/chloramphenicol resistance-like MFS transporter